MKTNAIVRIVLFSLAILILGSILLSVQAFSMYLVDGDVHFEQTDNIVSPMVNTGLGEITSQVSHLEIEWAAGSITIRKDANIDIISVLEYTNPESDYKTVMKQSGQTLKIQFSEKSVKFPSFGVDADISKDLVITVPANWDFNSIEIDAAAADVEIQGLQMNELDFDGASGNLVLDDCNIDKLDIDTASGDVEFTGRLDKLDFDAASAQFTGEFFNVPKQLNLDAMSGDMDLILPEYSGFYLELDTMSGSFDSDFDFHTIGEHYECGDSACKIKISGMSGDVSIHKGIPTPAENCNH